MSGWIGVDLDGTLAKYDTWIHEHHIGEPVPAMVERVKKWLETGMEVRVFTARVAGEPSHETITLIQDWTEQHIGARLPVTCMKDLHMIELWDDRCVQVQSNTGVPQTLLANAGLTLNQQLAQLLEGASAEKMIVAGVVTDPRNIEYMKLFSSIGERQAVDLFAAVVKTYNKGKVRGK